MQQKRWLWFQSILVRNENLSPKLLSLDFWHDFTHAIFSILHFPKIAAFTYYFLPAPNAMEPNIQSKKLSSFLFRFSTSAYLQPKMQKRIESVEILIENYNMQYSMQLPFLKSWNFEKDTIESSESADMRGLGGLNKITFRSLELEEREKCIDQFYEWNVFKLINYKRQIGFEGNGKQENGCTK